MKALIFALGLMLSGVAVAQCMTNTYFVNGRIVVCTVCCYGGSCTTTCF